jgi:hypothetical protein
MIGPLVFFPPFFHRGHLVFLALIDHDHIVPVDRDSGLGLGTHEHHEHDVGAVQLANGQRRINTDNDLAFVIEKQILAQVDRLSISSQGRPLAPLLT